jgi:hypothetical protein
MKGTFDREDAFLAPLFAIATAATVGVANVTLFGASLQDTLFTLGNEAIPVGTAIAVAIFAAAYVTNDADMGKLNDEYTYAVLGTGIMLVAIPVIPALLEFIKSSDFLAIAVIGIQAMGYAGVSYFA